jgi:MarR family transcriptional regulator for hemolysin
MNPDQQFGKLLKRVHQLWHQVINERLRPRDVSHSQWRVVLEVSRSASPMTQSALAAELGVESPTMVRLLDRLAQKGWIAREPCPDDRRARFVRLTPRAQRLARELEVVVGDVRRELLQDLRVAELAGCIAALSKVEARAILALGPGRGRVVSTTPAPRTPATGTAAKRSASRVPRKPRPKARAGSGAQAR